MRTISGFDATRVTRLVALLSLLWLLILVPSASAQDDAAVPFPDSVVLVGNLQGQLGCAADWSAECEATALKYDPVDDLWKASFDLVPGEYLYRVALNGMLEEGFGRYAAYGGEDIQLSLSEDSRVTFYYSYETGWVTDNVNSIIANVPGNYQPFIGCPGEWLPDCLRSLLEDPEEDGVYTFVTTYIPAGDYEAKVAVGENWDENYGEEGISGGNISFSVPAQSQVTFTWDSASKAISIAVEPAPEGAATEPPVYATGPRRVNPDFVTIPGTIQSVLGCSGDWMPDCSNTFLTLDEAADVWRGSFELPAGEYEYKVAINQTWGENYGLDAVRDGPNIPLAVPEGGAIVTFYYDHKSHWVTDDVNSRIVSVAGSFQQEVGCPIDDDPTCLTPWLVDPEGDGIYEGTILSGRTLPGSGDTYQAYVVFGEGQEGVGPEVAFSVPADTVEIYFKYESESDVLTVNTAGAPKGNLKQAQAHWVTRDTIAWNLPTESGATRFLLHYSLSGGLELDSTADFGGEVILLSEVPGGLSDEILARFPHLAGATALRIGPDDLRQVRIALKGQVVVSAQDSAGAVVDATGLQIPGVLDDVYVYDGPLGISFEDGAPTLRVWAPTARAVNLHLFADGDPGTRGEATLMRADPETGVWSATGDPGWYGQYYLYEVQVYVPATDRVESNFVTDPYSVSLAMNSTRSQIVDLADPAFAPEGWAALVKPALAAPEDVVLYELHVRDFSVSDATVPEALRGTFAAFTVTDSDGMRHLKTLQEAGLTHLHLLPAFDIATISEDKSTWQSPEFATLAALPPDSEEQQALVMGTAGQDGFNWGYDPLHYNVPEGSYSTEPDGPARILEFRQMVQALNQAGIRVVMDVVYNHTKASGQSEKSILDRVVPGYYHRLTDIGAVANSTCCANTATEHNMMRKLMIDSVVQWATAYKVDGFRFDLMGHHMKEDMLALRAALDDLTLEVHGVDGRSIYVYGEGWDFGEVAGNARGVNATQRNMAGTGIGTFNDRVRDAVRGGSPFGGYQEQGFATGLLVAPNQAEVRSEEAQRQKALLFADQIRVALAGNLADYRFTSASGAELTGADIDYNGQPAGYTADPGEHIVYISAHDNETWFDAIQYKLPADASMAERVRVQNLGLSLVGLAQGVPFYHAGSDMLRSKSFDRDSYDSGDWFNRLDFTYQDNGWGSGLPPASKNRANWPLMAPLLADPALQPAQGDIEAAAAHLRDVLAIRKSSSLFRLQSAAEVQARLRFHNTGPNQVPGLIVMSLSDVGSTLDPEVDMIVVLFNGNPEAVTFPIESLQGASFSLHPVQATAGDPRLAEASFAAGAFTVPGRSAAVFVAPEGSLNTTLMPVVIEQPTPESEPAASEATATMAPEPTSPAAPEPAETVAVEQPAAAEPATPTVEAEESDGGILPWVAAGGAAAAAAGAATYVLRRRRRND
jgi:pullulanase-type alpha-1,6-glucosidase